jgi:hypothetical protein
MVPASSALARFRRDLRANDHAAPHSVLEAHGRTLVRYGAVTRR